MNILLRLRPRNCFTLARPTRARSWFTTLRRKMRHGFGMSPGRLAGFPPAAITEPTCLRDIRNCPASLSIGSSTRSLRHQGTRLPIR